MKLLPLMFNAVTDTERVRGNQSRKYSATVCNRLHKFDESQTAFIDCDDTMENLPILNTIISDTRLAKREVHTAIVDLKKAFDSVTHGTIIDTITAHKCPKPFVKYISSLYANAQTVLQYKSTETKISVRRGVLQGDPLSPLLFNAVIERAIRAIPETVGYCLNGKKFNCVAYADDVIIVASTKMGMKMALSAFVSSLMPFGHEINVAKSSTRSLVPSGKDKKMKILTEAQFKINDTFLEPIGPLELWKYLGVYFRGARMMNANV